MRPGRLDRILYVGAPDLEARRDIFRIKLATMAVEPEFDLEDLAQSVSPSLIPMTSIIYLFNRDGG